MIAVYAFAVTLGVPSGTVYKVTGRAWIDVAFTIPGLVILVALLLIFTDEGILAVALCTAALPVCALPIRGRRSPPTRSKLSPLKILGAVAPAFVCGAVMAAVMFPLHMLISAPLLAVVVVGLAGALAYAGMTFLVARGRRDAAARHGAAEAGGALSACVAQRPAGVHPDVGVQPRQLRLAAQGGERQLRRSRPQQHRRGRRRRMLRSRVTASASGASRPPADGDRAGLPGVREQRVEDVGQVLGTAGDLQHVEVAAGSDEADVPADDGAVAPHQPALRSP